MAKAVKQNQRSEEQLLLKFQSLLKNRQQLTSIFNIESFQFDSFTNYKFEEFKTIQECIERKEYSFYCYTLCRWTGGITGNFYLVRISDIEIVDSVNFIFICPAYKLNDSNDMAKRKVVLTEPNKLGLTPGKLSIDLSDLPQTKFTKDNSYYDAKLKKRILYSEMKQEKDKTPKLKFEKKEKIEDEMVNNTDEKIEGQLHSSHFLPPIICTRLWVLSRGSDVGWAWFMKDVDGSKTKSEYYCRPKELNENQKQYDRGGAFVTHAYMKSQFSVLDEESLSQERFIILSKEFKDKRIESIQVIIDALLCK